MPSPLNSPFPGMDPYLEAPAIWPDFHVEMLAVCRTRLLDHLPAGYEASVEERLRLFEREPEPRSQERFADVAVTSGARWRGGVDGGGGGGGVATAGRVEAVTVDVPLVAWEERERWIEVVRQPERRVVTVIELLSPTNKGGSGFREYQHKRQELIRNDIHLVEIDLLLGGRRVDPERLLPAGDYYVLLTRRDEPERRIVYPWTLPTPLPAVPIPLDEPDPDVELDLSAALAEAYRRGRYRRRLRYANDAPVLVDEEAKRWARERVEAESGVDQRTEVR